MVLFTINIQNLYTSFIQHCSLANCHNNFPHTTDFLKFQFETWNTFEKTSVLREHPLSIDRVFTDVYWHDRAGKVFFWYFFPTYSGITTWYFQLSSPMRVSSPSNSFYLWIENKIKTFSFPYFQLYLSKSILHILNWPYSKLKRSTSRLGYTLNAETHNIRLIWIGNEEVKLFIVCRRHVIIQRKS